MTEQKELWIKIVDWILIIGLIIIIGFLIYQKAYCTTIIQATPPTINMPNFTGGIIQ